MIEDDECSNNLHLGNFTKTVHAKLKRHYLLYNTFVYFIIEDYELWYYARLWTVLWGWLAGLTKRYKENTIENQVHKVLASSCPLAACYLPDKHIDQISYNFHRHVQVVLAKKLTREFHYHGHSRNWSWYKTDQGTHSCLIWGVW